MPKLEMMMLKMRPEIRCRATVKLKKHMEFELPKAVIARARRRNHDNPVFWRGEKDIAYYALYAENKKIVAKMLHSWDSFIEEDK